jgi:hypothetical protein
MYLPSCGTERKRMGTEPDARMTCLASKVRSEPSAPFTATLFPGSKRPCPWMPATPLALNKELMPLVMVLTTDARRFCIAPRSRVRAPILIPCTANSSFARWNSSEDSSKAFDGMQPAFKQVPPKA